MLKSLRVAVILIALSAIVNSGIAQLTFSDPVTGSPTTAYTLSPALCQGASVDHCIAVSGIGASSYSITSFTGSQGTIVVAPPSNPQQRCFRYTAPFTFTGSNTITFNVTSNLGQTGSVQITIVVVNPNTPINAGPDQQLCSPTNSTVLNAISPDPLATGYWTKLSGTATISGGSDSPAISGVDAQGGPSVTVSNLQLGPNTFIWHQDYPCDQNVDVVVVYVYNGTPPVADANICFPSTSDHATDNITLCGTSSYTLCANNPGTAATGTWTIFGGCGTIFNINNPSAPVSNLCAGCNYFEWNIGNGPCPGGETKDTLTICVYPTVQPAVAPADLTRCIGSFTTVNLVGNTPTGANTVQWSFVSGPVTPGITSPTTSTTSITGLTQPGIYCFNYTITSGPCGSSTDQVCISVFSPTSPVNAGADQTVCLPNNSTTLAALTPTFPASGSWTVVAGTGSFVNATSPTTVVNGLSLGTNTFRWTVANGNCANNGGFDDVSIIVYPVSQPTPNAGPDQNLSFNGTALATTLAANSATAPGTGSWTISPSGPVITNPSSPTSTVTNLTPGVYTLTWCLNNGSCDPAVCDNMIINVFNCQITSTNAGNDQNYCTPQNSANMSAAVPTAPAAGTWSIITGSGSITNVNSATTSITNIPVGINTFRWTINNGGCGSFFDDVIVNIFDQNATISQAGPDQEFCAGSPIVATMAANTPTSPATGAWSALGSGTITSVSSPTSTITNLPVGTHNFVWTVNNGPCGIARDTLSIRVYAPGQTAANAGADQELCSNNPNTTLVANNLISPATGLWIVVSGGGSIVNPTSSATAVNNIPIGQNIFRWTIYNGPCATPSNLVDEVRIDVFDQNQAAANAGPDQEVCSDQSTVQLSGSNINVPSTGLWTVSPAGPSFSSNTISNPVVSNLSPGTSYTFTWSVDNGPCSNTSDSIILNYYNANQPAANAGADQAICLPQTSITMTANEADSPAIGTWTVISGPNTPSFSANNPTTTVNNLIAGTYVFRWSIDNGACSPELTFDDMIIEVFDEDQSVANAGLDQELCEPVNFTTLTGNTLISPATGLWTQISGPNTATINNPNLAQIDVTNLIVGCYVFRWSVNNGACEPPLTTDDIQVCLFDDDQTPADAGEDQVLCTPSSSTALDANPIIFPATGTWTVVQAPNSPVFSDINNPDATISNLIVGTYILEWSVDNGACFNSNTSDQVTILVYDSNAPGANAGADQAICTPQDAVFMQGNSPVGPATGLWTVITGSGAIVDANDPLTEITNLPVGTNCFQWVIDNGGCGLGTTADQVCIDVFPSNQPPADAGPDQDLCTPQSSTEFEANIPIAPATGSWVQINGPTTAVIANTTNPRSGVSNLDVGCYEFVWTIDNGACPNPLTSDTIQICIFNSGFPPAFAGNDQELCSPVSSTVLDADPAVSPGQGTWTQISGPSIASFSDINDSLATVSNLEIGVYNFEWSLNYSACGSEASTVTITIYNSDQGPSVAGPDQELCTPQSSTTMAADPVLPPGFGTWSSPNSTIDFVNPNDPNTVAFNLPQGIDTLVWTIYNGPCLAEEFTRDTVIIYIYDVNQPEAFSGLDQDICSNQSVVNLLGTSLISPATGLWTTSGTATIASPTSASTDVSDLSVGINTFCWTIENGACVPPSTSDCVDIYVFDENQPAANAGPDMNVCGSITNCAILAGNNVIFPAQGTWTQIGGPTTVTFNDDHSSTSEVCGMIPGVYTLQWCIDNGPCGPVTCDEVTITIFNEDTEPATVGEDIEICTPQSSVTMNASVANLPGFGVWNLISGGGNINDPDNPQTIISSLPIGVNTFSWCVSNGVCPNSSTCDSLNILVFDENAPAANAGLDVQICDPIGSFNLQATVPAIPGYGTWSIVSGSGAQIVDPNDPQSAVTGLTVGTYIFQWTVYNGPCDNTNTTDQVTIEIFDHLQPAAFAGDDIYFCTPQNSAQMNANAATSPASGFWQIVAGSSGSVANNDEPNTIINGLTPGVHYFTWTIENGPCIPSTTTDTVAIYVYDQFLPDAYAGEDDSLCAPFDLSPICNTLSGSNLGGAATGLWTQISGPSTASILSPESPETEVCGLLVGVYQFQWSVDNGPCGPTNDIVEVVINDPNQTQPSAGEDAFYCTPTSTHIMSATPAIAPAYTYWQAITPNVVISDINDPNTLVSNLPVGQHIFLWRFNNGACAAETFDDVSVFIYDEFNPPADAGPDIELCLPQTEVSMAASFPFYPAVGQWEVVQGCPGIFITDVNNPLALITNLCVGTQCLTWTVDNGPCPQGLTQDTICVRLFNPDITVDAGPDQSVCTPQTTVTMSATVPVDPNTGTWTNISGGGSIDNATLANTTISDLPVGINCFDWTFYNGPCENNAPGDQLCIFVYDQGQPPADAGEDQEICFPSTSATLTGNTPIVPAVGFWTLVSGSGNIVSPSAPTTEVTDLEVGDNVFTWTINNGPCIDPITVDTVIIHLFPFTPNSANAGSDQELCTPEQSVVLSANVPTPPSTYTWVVNSLGGTISDLLDPNATLDFLTVGIHTLEWHIYNGPCNAESVDEVSIFVYDATAPLAAAGPDQEICAPNETVQMAGSVATFPGIGTWTLGSHPGSPVIESPNDSTTTVSGLAIGITELIWTFDNGDCGTSTDTMRVFVYDPNSPDASVNNDTILCDPPSCVQLIGSQPIFPAYGWWEQIAGDQEASIADTSAAVTEACGLALNESAFVWHVYNGPCDNGLTSDTVWFYIYDSGVSAAFAGNDTAFCGIVDAFQFEGSTLVGSVEGLATGQWTGSAGSIINPELSDAILTDVPVGVHCYTWTVDNGACGTSSDEMCITVYDSEQAPANAGEGQVICSNLFEPFNLAANEVTPPGTGYWTVASGPADIDDPENNDALVSYLGSIITDLESIFDTLVWTIDNGVCGTSSDTIVFEVQDCETVKIPDAFSPNGDGTNDVFFISNLQYYPNNSLKIFNRWGAEVFNAAPYKGDWDGTSTGSGTIGEPLPVSTYYYVLSIGAQYEEVPDKVFTGFVYLKR